MRDLNRRSNVNFVGVVAILVGFAISTNGLELNASGLAITPERFLVIPLWIFGFSCLFFGGGERWPKYTPFILISWLCFSLLSSALSEVTAWSLKMWGALLVASSYYFFIFIFNAKPLAIFSSKSFRLLSWCLGPLSVIIYFFTVYLGVNTFVGDFWLQEGAGGVRIRAAITEANLFGVFIVLVILVNMAMAVEKTWKSYALLIFLNISIFLSFSRSPWLSYVVAVSFYALIIYPRRITSVKFGLWFVLFLLLSLLILFMAFFLLDLVKDIEIVSRTNTIDARFVMWNYASVDIEKNPILGSGVFSFSALHPSAPSEVGSETYRSAWISNIFLAILHDSGIVGFLVFSSFFMILVVRAIRVIRQAATSFSIARNEVHLGGALLAATLGFLISGQTIPAFSLAFFWVTLALLEMQTLVLKNKIKDINKIIPI